MVDGLASLVVTDVSRCQENRLWVADPKALHHMFHATGYLYRKSANSREMSSIIADEGLLSADGKHKIPYQGSAPVYFVTRCCSQKATEGYDACIWANCIEGVASSFR